MVQDANGDTLGLGDIVLVPHRITRLEEGETEQRITVLAALPESYVGIRPSSFTLDPSTVRKEG